MNAVKSTDRRVSRRRRPLQRAAVGRRSKRCAEDPQGPRGGRLETRLATGRLQRARRVEARSRVRADADDDEDILYKVSTAEQRDFVLGALEQGQYWMYTDEVRDLSKLRKKHHKLQGLFSPLEDRASELEARPAAIEALRSALNDSSVRARSLRELHESANSSDAPAFDIFNDLVQNTTV